MHSYINYFTEELRKKENPEYAARMASYMKGHFSFFGIQSPIRKEIMRAVIKQHGIADIEELIDIACDMWELPQREYQYIAMDLLNRKSKKFRKEDIGFIETLITSKSWWDTVDFIASNFAGKYFELYPAQKLPVTRLWMESGNMWLQRSAIIFQLKYKDKTDEDLLFEYILLCSGSKEFFIQKAIGWALRQYAKFQPEVVKRFVENNDLKPLSKREALKALK